MGAAPSGYLSSRSLPSHQPAKWNGMKLVPGPTRSVTSARTLRRAPVGVDTHTKSQYLMPRSNSTRRPEVSTIGHFCDTLSCSAFCCTVLYNVGRRQNAFLSSCVGYLA